MPEADTVTIRRPEKLSDDMTVADLVEVLQHLPFHQWPQRGAAGRAS